MRIILFLIIIFGIKMSGNAQEDAALTIVHALDKVNLPSENLVNHVKRDIDNNLWMCSNYGVFKYTGYTATRYSMEDGLGDNLLFGSYEDSKHRIWFRSYNGKIAYYFNGKIHNKSNDSLCKKLDFNSIIIRIEEQAGKIVFASQADGLKILENNQVKTVDIKVIKQFFWESDTVLKIITSVGIYNYNLKTDIRKNILPLDWGGRYTSIISKNKQTLLTYGSDAYELKEDKLNFLFSVPYPMHEIICMEQYDQHNYIFGTRKGIVIYNVDSKSVDVKYFGKSVPSITMDKKNQFWMSIEDYGVFYVRNLVDLNIYISKIQDISCLYKDKEKNIWVGTRTGNVVKISPDGTEKYFDFSTYIHRKDKVTQIFESPDNQVVILNKLFISTIENDKITKVIPVGGNEACIDENNKKTLWIRSIQLAKFKIDKNIISNKEFVVVDKKFNALHAYKGKIYAATNQEFGEIIKDSFRLLAQVESIITDINDKYVLTNFGIIYEITPKGLKKLPFHPPAKLSSDKLVIRGEKLFLCTNQGLFVYDLRNYSTRYVKSFRSLAIRDIIVDERHAYIGTLYALYKVTLSFLFMGENSTEIITSFNTIKANKTRLHPNNALRIPYSDRDLTVNFSVKSYFIQPAIFYKIDNKEWVKTNNFYIPALLEPGLHKVYVYAKTDESPKIIGAKELSIEILKPYWQMWWFRFLALFFFSVVIFSMYKFWTYRIKKQYDLIQEEENKKYEKLALENEIILLEQKALRMQMNPHFIFNAINTFKGFYAENNERDGSKYINNFSKLLRNILENESFVNSLLKEVEIAENYLKMMQVKYPQFKYEIITDQLDLSSIGVPSMMLQPFVENAVIHGIGPKKGIGLIEIVISSINSDQVLIKIVDDGLGISKSSSLHQSKSFGITSNRLKIFNQNQPFQLSLTNNVNLPGTTVTIITKFKKL